MKKRILYIHHGKGLGGAPLSLLALIKTLDRNRYHPVVLFLNDSEVVGMYKNLGIEVHGPVNRSDFPHTAIWSFKWYHAHYLARAVKDTIITAASAAATWLDKLTPDIVHLNTSSLIAWGYVAHKKNIPVVWHIREPLAHGYVGLRKQLVTKAVRRYATHIIPISSNDARPWASDKRTLIMHNPVDHSLFDYSIYQNNAPRQPTILFLGGLSQEKGTLLMLTIFQALLARVPNAHLVIAGYFNPWKKAPLPRRFFPEHLFVQAVKKLYIDLAVSITLTGPSTKVPELLSTSTVLAFPATVGHFARPVIEAGFMRTPVVASKLAPLDELVVDGVTGYLCAPTNIADWITKLEELLTNHGTCTTMGQAAHTFCREHFGLENYGKKIESVYATILEKEKGYGPRET